MLLSVRSAVPIPYSVYTLVLSEVDGVDEFVRLLRKKGSYLGQSDPIQVPLSLVSSFHWKKKMSLDLRCYVKRSLFEELESIGDGMKTLLMDENTTSVLSLAVPQSQIMRKEVYLLQDLHSHSISTKDPKLFHLKCVIVVRNSQENLHELIKELSNPRYSSYYIFFINPIEPGDLKRLAEADISESVKEIKELPIDYDPLLDNVFLSKIKSVNENKKIVESIRSLMKVMKMTSAGLLYQSNSSECDRIASLLRNAASNNDSGFGTVLILDRRFDSITPLITNWSYLALINDIVGLRDNKISIENEGKNTTIFLSTEDQFFRKNLFSNFGMVGTEVSALLKERRKFDLAPKDTASLDDLKDFIAKYPEFKKMTKSLDNHVSIGDKISKAIDKRNLLEVSSVEQDVACAVRKSTVVQELKKLLEKVNEEDGFRVSTIAGLKFKDPGIFDGIKSRINFNEVMNISRKVSGSNKSIYSSEDRLMNVGQSIIQEFKDVDNRYELYQPPLKDILSNIMKGKLSNLNLKALGNYDTNKKLIVFIIGGITAAEIAAVNRLNQETGSTIVIGGTALLNQKDYLEELQKN